MKKAFWIAGIVIFGGVRPSHAFLGRDSVSSRWPDGAVQIDGRATEWSEYPVQEEAGMGFRAMNDASSLYILVRGTDNDGRIVLSGKYRQNVTLWFLKPDHKSKAWGINLDFSRAQSAAPDAPPTLASLGIAPERVVPQGLEVSTTTFPEGVEFQADLSSQRGRQPIYEMRIPLDMIERHGNAVYLDFLSSEVSSDVKAELQSGRSEQHASEATPPPSGSGSSGGHHHRGGGGSPGAGAASSVDIPKPLALHLTIDLVKEPKH